MQLGREDDVLEHLAAGMGHEVHMTASGVASESFSVAVARTFDVGVLGRAVRPARCTPVCTWRIGQQTHSREPPLAFFLFNLTPGFFLNYGIINLVI